MALSRFSHRKSAEVDQVTLFCLLPRGKQLGRKQVRGQGRWHRSEQGQLEQPPLHPQADLPFLRLRIITAIAQASAANTRPPTNRLAQFCIRNDDTAMLKPLLKYNMGRAS